MAILPRNPADPQGTDDIERRAMRDYKRRLKGVAKAYAAALDSLPVTIVTNAKTYVYELDAVLLQSLLDRAGLDADALMLEGGAYEPWFFEQYVQAAMVRGIQQQTVNIAQQSEAYKATRGSIVLSQPHVRRMALARARVFEEMQGLSQQVKTDMGRILADGIGRGQSPTAIARTLNQQLGIEQFRANRIARTEVAAALRRAKWDEADDAAETMGTTTKEMHYSALSSTTRRNHAARHGKLYTREEARAWWAQGSESINCKCGSVTLLIGKDGQPVSKGIVARAEATKAKMEARDYEWSKDE